MAHPHLTLSWEAYSKHVCNGIVDMQQHGDLVDMTIAADGHLVKVHKMVLCLASPYIKELISTAPCSHPVIFLNKVSHHTLCLLLEYIYTGTVQVPQDQLQEMIEAGRELHIKGLMDMEPATRVLNIGDNVVSVSDEINLGKRPASMSPPSKHTCDKNDSTDQQVSQELLITICSEDDDATELGNIETLKSDQETSCNDSEYNRQQVIQYTVSNQGKLQMILNRFMYRLRWVYNNQRDRGLRRWLCVDNTTSFKCNAAVVTKDGIVLKRFGVHNHSFHDKRIMKKIQKGAVYAAVQQAEDANATDNKIHGD